MPTFHGNSGDNTFYMEKILFRMLVVQLALIRSFWAHKRAKKNAPEWYEGTEKVTSFHGWIFKATK